MWSYTFLYLIDIDTKINLFSRAFTGKYNKTKDAGIYSCVVCSQDLFASSTKFESGCGWPAFSDVIDQGRVKLSKDASHGKLDYIVVYVLHFSCDIKF